jgi:tetratricopeptide (TPR) repeat protein
MPELGTGISYAQLGHWDKAIILFKSVPEKYPKNENIHKAYYDLGIAYKWSYMFSEARENLEKAYLLKNKSEYYDEIQRLASFEQEYMIRQSEGWHPGN